MSAVEYPLGGFDAPTDGEWQHWRRLERDLWISDCRARRPEPRRELALRGEIDVLSAPALAHALREASEAPVASLVLHIDKVSFFDAAGVREFARAAEQLESKGGRLRLRHASGLVAKVLEITGLGRLSVPEP
jgi:anti-anti-sigma factor